MSNSWQSKGWGLAESYARKLRSEQCEPVKFEAGQVIGVDIYGDGNEAPLLVCKMNAPVVTTNELRCGGVEVCLRPQEMVVSPALLSPAPRAGDTWTSGESVARIEVDQRGARFRIISEGDPFVGDVVAVARRLWEGGYRRVKRTQAGGVEAWEANVAKEKARAGRTKYEGPQSATLLPGITPIERTPDGGQRVTRNDLPHAGEYWKNATTMIVLRECLEGLHTCVIASEERWPMQHIGNAEQTAEFLRENGYRKVGQVPTDCEREQIRRETDSSCVPALSAGMLVRRSVENLIGLVTSLGHDPVIVKWHGDDKVTRYDLSTVRAYITSGHWHIVTPDVAPLASLARAVAAIFERADLATSRRHIDTAIATLRGEPFARAIAAALVAASDHALAPFQIAALVRGARAYERRRSEVAPGIRSLTAGQFDACWAAAHYESESQWSRRLSEVYERARSL